MDRAHWVAPHLECVVDSLAAQSHKSIGIPQCVYLAVCLGVHLAASPAAGPAAGPAAHLSGCLAPPCDSVAPSDIGVLLVAPRYKSLGPSDSSLDTLAAIHTLAPYCW